MNSEERRIGELKNRVTDSKWSKAKKHAFFDYLNLLSAKDRAERTQFLYARHVFLLGEFLAKKNFSDYTEQDMLAYKTELKKTYAPYSVYNMMLDAQTFLKWHLKLEKTEKPKCMKWFTGEKKNVMKKLKPEEILRPEEIKQMVAAAGSLRNKAIIFCLWESGCRISEFLSIKVSDLKIEDKVISFEIHKGKTKESEREVFLINSVPTLKDWLEVHVRSSQKDAYLFYGVSKNSCGKKLSPTHVHCILARTGKKIGFEKPVNPHALRKSRATYMTLRNTNPEIMKKMFGWSESSNMPAYYSSIGDNDVKKLLMQEAGLEEKDEKVISLEPIKCPFCGEVNSVEATICKNIMCMKPVTEQGILEHKKQRGEKQRELWQDIIQEEFKKLRGEMLLKIQETKK